MLKAVATTASLIMLLLAYTAHAETFRCGTHIIDRSMSADEILEACGEPSSRQPDEWVYDRGPGELAMRIHFYADGRVDHIVEVRTQQ
jgi:hypothetical protein